jgi:vacuolar-type H+-ATPase subunit I/STV1
VTLLQIWMTSNDVKTVQEALQSLLVSIPTDDLDALTVSDDLTDTTGPTPAALAEMKRETIEALLQTFQIADRAIELRNELGHIERTLAGEMWSNETKGYVTMEERVRPR